MENVAVSLTTMHVMLVSSSTTTQFVVGLGVGGLGLEVGVGVEKMVVDDAIVVDIKVEVGRVVNKGVEDEKVGKESLEISVVVAMINGIVLPSVLDSTKFVAPPIQTIKYNVKIILLRCIFVNESIQTKRR